MREKTSMYNHGHKLSLYYCALAMLAVFATVGLCAGFCIDRAFALDTGGLTGTGSIAVHAFETSDSSTSSATGTEDDAAQLPADAVPVSGAKYSLYALDVAQVEGAGGTPPVSAPPAEGELTSFLTTYAAAGVSLSTPTASGLTDASGTALFDGLSFGYYLLIEDSTATAPMLITLPYANDQGLYVSKVHVYPKSVVSHAIEKTCEAATAVVGFQDVVPWKVSFPVPAGLKEGSAYGRDWSVSDELDERLDWNDSWTIEALTAAGSVMPITLVPGTDVICTYDAVAHVVTWAFSDTATRRIVDAGVASLAVSFDTTVNAKALSNVEPIYNDASIDFVNATGDPFHHEVIEGAPDAGNPAHPRVYVGAVFVEKVLEGDGRPLAGAEFAVAASLDDARSGRYVERTVEGERHTVTVSTDAAGKASIGALAPGAYYLIETKAPTYEDAAGNKVQCAALEDPIAVEIGVTAEGAHAVVKVTNRPATAADAVVGVAKSLFPKTGDFEYTLIAMIMVVVAVACSVAWKTRERRSGAQR